jgi:DNA polymerase I
MIIQDIGGNELFIRYRDENNNIIIKREGYKPYYWILNDTGHESFNNYDGSLVYKKYYANSKDRTRLRGLEKSYELDVSLENRYLIDKYPEIPEWKPRIMHIDIETLQCLDSKNAPEPITAITIHDSYTNQYHTFSWKRNNKLDLSCEGWTVYITNTEKGMLNKFREVFLNIDPDIITGWNIINFDIPYIINRHHRLDKGITWISPINEIDIEFNEHTKDPIKGRIVFDLKFGYEKLHDGDIGFTALKSVLEDNDAPIRKLEGMDDYENDFENFLKYNLRDVEGTVWIDNRFDIIQAFLERQRLVGCKFSDTYYNKDVIDCSFLRFANKRGIVLPTAIKAKDETYEGATIYKPVTGFHKNVVVLDVKSMYPSSMEAANMSFETILDDETKISPEYLIKLGNGVCFRKDFESFTTDLLHDIQDYREYNKSMMKKYEEDSPEYKKYDSIQRVAKFLKNSLYGVFGFRSFRLYNINIARSITWLSRQAIAHIRETVETSYPDCKVIYGHTDSVFVETPNTNIAKEIEDTINNSWGKFEERYNLIPGKYEIEIDKIFSSLLVAGANMYAGRLVGKDKLVVKGFAVKKKSTPPIVKNLQGNVINMVLDEEDPEKIFAFIKEIVETIRYGNCTIDDIAVKMKLKRKLESYAGNSIHVTSAKWANENLGANLNNIGDVVKLVCVVKDEVAKKYNVNSNKVIAFENEESIKEFTIDYEETINRLIPGKLNLIFKAMRWDLSELLRENDTIGADCW